MRFVLLACILCVFSEPLFSKTEINIIEMQSKTSVIYADLSWLKLSDNVQTEWKIKTHEEKKEWLTISPKEQTATSKPYTIMAIVSKHSSSYSQALSRILDVFQQHKINARFLVLNINKNTDLAQAAVTYGEENNVDLLLSLGSSAMTFLATNYSHGKIPVVTSTNKDPVALGYLDHYKGGNGGNIAFTSLNISLDIQLDYLRTLKPNLKAIALLYNKNHKQVMATEVEPAREYFDKKGVTLIEVAVTSRETAAEELKQELGSAVERLKRIDPTLDNVLLWLSSSTAIFSNIQHVNQYAENIPVISSIPNAVKQGKDSAVLAIGIDRRNNAHLAALYAIDILTKGKNPGDIDVGIVSPPDISVNFLVAKKIGLKIPFKFVESSNFIYDYDGNIVRSFGKRVYPSAKYLIP